MKLAKGKNFKEIIFQEVRERGMEGEGAKIGDKNQYWTKNGEGRQAWKVKEKLLYGEEGMMER